MLEMVDVETNCKLQALSVGYGANIYWFYYKIQEADEIVTKKNLSKAVWLYVYIVC